MPPRIRLGNNRADGFLIKPLESLSSLQILQMASDGSLGLESGGLLLVDPAEFSQSVQPVFLGRPAFPLRERLPEEREIAERLHRDDTGLGLECRTKCIKIELGLQMVHSRIQERFTVQADPEPDRIRL